MKMKPRALVCALAFGFLVASAAPGQSLPGQKNGTSFRGLSLKQALQVLQAAGLPVVFSSNVVRDSMRVESEPRGMSPREILGELLRPHGLRAEEVAGRLVVVAAEPPRVAAPPRPPDIEPEPMPRMSEEIVVTPGRTDAPQESPAPVHLLDPAEAAELPHLGNDMFRAISLLPGAASTEASSRLSIRGGRDDEVLVALDGLELLAPYHLQELDSALSIVAPTFLGRVELSTGGYPAEYGDRMSGVIDMTTLAPPDGPRFGLGIGLVFAEASAAGAFAGDRGRWYSAFRGGDYHLALEVREREEEPRYWDTFSKLEYSLRPGQALQLNALFAEDELDLPAAESDGESYRSEWGNRYLWLTHDAVLGPDLFVESIVSAGRLDRARNGAAVRSEASFDVRDDRLLALAGFKNAWRFQPWERTSFEAGAELRQLRSTVDYFNDRELTDPLAPLRPEPPVGTTRFRGVLSVDQSSAFASSRLRPFDALTAELGARFDHNSALDESRVSPRFNLAWAPRDDSVFRLAWGWFHQSQRPNELQVEDGETALAPSERAEHRILGFEHRRESGATVRVEAYQRLLSHPRVRFENLFDPIVLFPELTGDRVRIGPDGGRAQGIELSYRSPARGPLGWGLSYAFSSIEDELDGRWVPRGNDQPHALQADLNYRMAQGWNLHAVWLYHTGWPTTRVTGRAVSGPGGTVQVEPVLGPFHAERLPAYHRLDARLSRTWKLPLGQLNTYLEVQNLYDRENVRGFDDFSLDPGADGEPRVDFDTLSWGEFLPSFGIRWQF